HVRLLEREYRLPVILHVHHRPAFGPGFLEPLVEAAEGGPFAVVNPLAVDIGMVNVEAEAQPGAGSGPLEHLKVTIRIAECCERPPADMHLDADGFSLSVVDEVDLRQTYQYRLPISQLELGLDAGADYLLRRHAVDTLAEDAHELDPATRDDERLESVRAQV